jgi:antitoxin ChpS
MNTFFVKHCLTKAVPVFRMAHEHLQSGVSKMEVILKKMGNSTALVMPPGVLKDLGLHVGHALRLETTQDGKVVLTPKTKHRLADLLAQCDLKAAPPADLAFWDQAKPVGAEVW